ncbi:MAG: hypothetical protein H7062_19945, partial [Candidatus Saccharimonas sp.]|nr:hypothetical protein [Planctomycetaceae bacterium]
MDGRSSFEWSVARRSCVAAALCLLLLPFACRVPAPPVLKREPLVIMYDSAKDAELRSDRARRFYGRDLLERYVDTLAEPVAITEWSADHCTWEIFVATNRGWLESPDDPEAANRVLDEVHYGRCEATLPRNDVGLRMELEEKR